MENPLDKLKYMYTHVANDPSASDRTDPGDRLRAAAGQLESIILAQDTNEALVLARQVERELYTLQRFIKPTESSTPPAQLVESLYQAALQAHQQGWLALAQALETGDPATCADAVQLADEGDRLLAKADTELRTQREIVPLKDDLHDIQQWMQGLITDSGNDVMSAAAPQAAAVLTGSSTLEPIERLGVYRGMYLVRLAQSIHFDYRGLVQFLGWQPFLDLVKDYLQVHPPVHYNIARLSDNLPAYIEQRTDLPEQPYCLAMARLEAAMCQVHHAEPSPVLKHHQVAAVAGDALGRVQLQPIDALRMLELDYPVNDFVTSVLENGPRPTDTSPRPNQLVIFRYEYDTWRLPLSLPNYRFLESLVAGLALGPALDQAMAGGLDADAAVKSFFSWVSEGMFRGFTLAPNGA